ncbi:hypothetical protein TPENAI_30027 [Tenacibaculum litopenaei]
MGNELNEELDIQWHDYVACNYDAAIGGWMNVDPLAEEMRVYSKTKSGLFY